MNDGMNCINPLFLSLYNEQGYYSVEQSVCGLLGLSLLCGELHSGDEICIIRDIRFILKVLRLSMQRRSWKISLRKDILKQIVIWQWKKIIQSTSLVNTLVRLISCILMGIARSLAHMEIYLKTSKYSKTITTIC